MRFGRREARDWVSSRSALERLHTSLESRCWFVSKRRCNTKFDVDRQARKYPMSIHSPIAPTHDVQAALARQALQHVELRVGGMTCEHCPPAIEKALAAIPGVTSARVNGATQIAH